MYTIHKKILYIIHQESRFVPNLGSRSFSDPPPPKKNFETADL